MSDVYALSKVERYLLPSREVIEIRTLMGVYTLLDNAQFT